MLERFKFSPERVIRVAWLLFVAGCKEKKKTFVSFSTS